jgi:hypothetical protein
VKALIREKKEKENVLIDLELVNMKNVFGELRRKTLNLAGVKKRLKDYE